MKTLFILLSSRSTKIPTGISVLAIIKRIRSSNGLLSNNFSLPVTLSMILSGLMILVVKPNNLPKKVPS